jgi:hypothetical protein
LALVAAACQNSNSDFFKNKMPLSTGSAYLLFLCRESMDSFYLQEFRARDSTFFTVNPPDNFNNLEPKPHSKWDNSWRQKLKWLDGKPRITRLGWFSLRYDARALTVAELEVVLALFDWDEERPRFAHWVLRWPHILRTVHHFLLKRYCFSLLDAFEEARSVAKLRRPPYEVGKFWRVQVRMWGLVVVGIWPIVQTLGLTPFFPADVGQLHMPLILLATSGVLLWFTLLQDVFKQNHGVMASNRHARPRACRLWCMFAWRGAIAAAIAAASPSLYQAMNERTLAETFALCLHYLADVSPGELAMAFTGALSLGLTTALTGAVGQWIFSDAAVTEPV